MTISAVYTQVSTAAGVIGRYHYQISFTNVLAVAEERSQGVYPISSQLTVHITAEILFCLSAECHLMEGRRKGISQEKASSQTQILILVVPK